MFRTNIKCVNGSGAFSKGTNIAELMTVNKKGFDKSCQKLNLKLFMFIYEHRRM